MPRTTTKKKSAAPKAAGLEKRVSTLEAKLAEFEAIVEKCHKRVEQVVRAVATGTMDTL